MTLILNGGGSGDKTKDIYTFLDKIIDNSKPVLCIPLAREKDDIGYQSSKGYMESELDVMRYSELVIADSSDYISNANLNEFGLIYISGGNAYKLLQELKQTNAFDKVKNYLAAGGIVYGCSAGSIIWGANICSSSDDNLVGLQDFTGYDFLLGCLFGAHYTNKDEEKTAVATERYTFLSETHPVIALPEEDSLYINGDKIQIIGTRPYYIFNAGRNRAFKPGDVYCRDEFTTLIKSI